MILVLDEQQWSVVALLDYLEFVKGNPTNEIIYFEDINLFIQHLDKNSSNITSVCIDLLMPKLIGLFPDDNESLMGISVLKYVVTKHSKIKCACYSFVKEQGIEKRITELGGTYFYKKAENTLDNLVKYLLEE